MGDYYYYSSAFISKGFRRGKDTPLTLNENKPQCCLAALGNELYCII